MIEQTSTYHIAHFKKKEIIEGNLSLDMLLSDEINGFIIKDFLNSDELTKIIKGFRSITDKDLVHINNGFDSYPMSFAQFEQMLSAQKITEKEYFDFSTNYSNLFEEKFGVDILSRLQFMFSKIDKAPKLHIAPNPETTGNYIPFTFRELFAGEGCLKAHCENLFFHEFPGFFKRINALSRPENQLSFFIVLQSPGEGGELTLFDIIWNDKQKRPNDNEIIIEDGRRLLFDDKTNLKRDYLNPGSGSLVIFSGGKIWHRVETITQSPSRITLGGFLSFSHDQTKLYCWS